MYKFTDVHYEFRNNDIDLRHESDLLTDEFGINVLYVRNCKFVRCKCFDDLNKTGDPHCKLCFGTGHFSSLQKIIARESSNRPYMNGNYLEQLPIGVTDKKNEIYFIRYPIVPKERDYLIKTTWDKDGYPVDIVKVLQIIDVYEMRGDNGRIELNACVIDNRTDLVSPFSNIIKSLSKKILSPLVNGGKTICPSLHLK